MKKFFFLIFCLNLLTGLTLASSTKLFRDGNEAYAETRFEDAVQLFLQAAAKAPESAALQFNLGTAQYRTGAFNQAAASFEYAVSLAETDSMRSWCWYNLGNCLVKSAEALRETDPPSAAHVCRQASMLYRLALDYNPAFSDAAYNIEVTRRIAADIDEEIKAQQEKKKQENELFKYIREKLQEFIERQTKLIEGNRIGEPQQVLESNVRELAHVMAASGLHTVIEMPDGTRVPGPLKETVEHTINAADAMALPEPPTALAELMAALGSAPEAPNQQEGESDEESEEYDDYDMEYEESDKDADMYEEADPFGDFSEYEEIRGVPPPNQTEMDILIEEIQNQERRKEKKAGAYKPVDKDW